MRANRGFDLIVINYEGDETAIYDLDEISQLPQVADAARARFDYVSLGTAGGTADRRHHEAARQEATSRSSAADSGLVSRSGEGGRTEQAVSFRRRSPPPGSDLPRFGSRERQRLVGRLTSVSVLSPRFHHKPRSNVVAIGQ